MLRDLLVAEFFSLKGWDFSAPGIARGRGDEGLQPEGLRPVVVRILAALQAANPAESRPRAMPGAGGCQPFRLRAVPASGMALRSGLDHSADFPGRGILQPERLGFLSPGHRPGLGR